MRWVVIALAVTACRFEPALVDGGVDTPAPDAGPPPAITARVDSTRIVTAEAMLAAGEMQIAGEPLAEAMGRDLGGYSRDLVPADIYRDATGVFWIDLAGFSTGVESYEYSKQPMNAVAFELGAGTALAHAPLVPDLLARIHHYAQGSNALGKWVFDPGTFPTGNAAGNVNPTGAGTPADNPIGWPGMWPTLHVFTDFDPAIDPTDTVALQCSIVSDDNPNEATAPLIGADYECAANTLHLRDRASQITPAIGPGADGFTSWKYALWAINYLQIMHDDLQQPVDSVSEADVASVGQPGFAVHLGSSDIEGFQAQMFLAMLDARADDWLMRMTTTDGTTLSGFASLADALAYDYTAPLRWFPGVIAVAEVTDPSGFPVPTYAIDHAAVHVRDLVGLALGYATAYALTDTANVDVGGAQPARVFFDGDPFAADDQLADGEPTLHDRALAMIRVAVIALDRLHADSASLLADDGVVSTVDAAYTVIGLRVVTRALSSQLQLYSNNTPDAAVTATPLDALPIHYPNAAALTFSGRVAQLLRAQADLLLDHLTDPSGRAFAGWTVATSTVTAGDTIDAHAAAIRGLFAAYLATGDTRYRTRALAVFARMQTVFYDDAARIYTVAPAPTDTVVYTPLRFALVQSALRDVYELVAARPGGEDLEPLLEARIARLDKLVLNGWDDRDRDKHVTAPDECVNVAGGLPRGGLQMAERTLSGEVGRLRDEGGGPSGPPTSDRDADCVPEIDDAHLPAMLAGQITFEIHR